MHYNITVCYSTYKGILISRKCYLKRWCDPHKPLGNHLSTWANLPQISKVQIKVEVHFKPPRLIPQYNSKAALLQKIPDVMWWFLWIPVFFCKFACKFLIEHPTCVLKHVSSIMVFNQSIESMNLNSKALASCKAKCATSASAIQPVQHTQVVFSQI